MTAPPLRAALALLRARRRDGDVIITTMGAAREWLALGPLHPLDIVLVPSAMGQAPSWGLGLALARPDRRIVVVNGDGSMLMNLGSLITITAEQPANLALVLCDNQGYEVTGGQPTPGTAPARRRQDRIDFTELARVAGFGIHRDCRDLASFEQELSTILVQPGPVFVQLRTRLEPDARGPRSPGSAPERGMAFMEAFSNTS